MSISRRHILMLLTVSVIVACTRHTETAVPRRTAYPRITPYDTVYVPIDSLPLSLMVNRDAATVSERRADGSIWVNVSYPRYDATLYCTLTPVDDHTLNEVIDNRAERIHRNLGAAKPEFIEFETPGGYYVNVVLTPSATTTPVQFMAFSSDKPRWVVSGSAFFDHATPSTSIDSVMPMIDVLRRDVVYMLDNLR